ncbi:hypothetical protein RB653_003383 [Dictyostelium firmibasis]|uniref:Uncharacterized protein n=1 Tax=Dictyostelium firmibasis TaxID=79012 RepID=A0AAN7U905_9MYCE
MFKSVLYIFILAIFITLIQGQSIATGTWNRFAESSCSQPTSNITITQNSYGFQIISSKQTNMIANMTIHPDSSFIATGYLYYVTPPYSFSGFTSVKGIVYNPLMFMATFAPTSNYPGNTFYYSIASCN